MNVYIKYRLEKRNFLYVELSIGSNKLMDGKCSSIRYSILGFFNRFIIGFSNGFNMKAVFKIILKKILPPLVSDFLRNSQTIHFTGNYNSWDEASRKCLGYDDYLILKKVKSSALLVKTGKAVYERDSVIFENIEYSWPLLSGLLYSAVKNKGVLRVMDFGGSLGSTFFQNRKFISEIPEAIWGIIEQESFYKFGRDHIQGDKLIFFKSIKECVHSINPTVVIFSAVL